MARSNFFHVQCFAKGGDRGANFVLAEVARDAAACGHVQVPQPPTLLAGLPLSDLRIEFARLTEAARETTCNGRKRVVRPTQHTLLGAVASYPVVWSDLDSLAATTAYLHWRGLAVPFLASLAPAGRAVFSVVEHTDERFPHLHLVAAPTDEAMRAKALHPGYAARMAAQDEGLRVGRSPKEAARAGRRGYGRAMRGLQDSYHSQVGAPCGHSRLILGRAARRLPRGEKLAIRAAHDARDAAILACENLERERAEIVAEAEREGYAHGYDGGYEIGRRAGTAAVISSVAELNLGLKDAEQRNAILHEAWSGSEVKRTALEEENAVLHLQIAQLKAALTERAEARIEYGR